MVLKTFCWKFGLWFEKDSFHRYAFEISNYRKSHHIECLINTNEVKIMYEDGISNIYPVEYFIDKKVIFAEFCDGKHNLTGAISHDEAKNVAFNLVKAFLIDRNDGTQINVFLDASNLNFILVLEDFK